MPRYTPDIKSFFAFLLIRSLIPCLRRLLPPVKTTIPSDQISSIKLYIKHITQPKHFQGNVKLWLNKPWFNVLEFKNSKHPNILINETMKENYPEPQILLKDSLGINDIIAKLRLYIGAIF